MSKESWEEKATEQDLDHARALKRTVAVRRAYRNGTDRLGSNNLSIKTVEGNELIIDRKTDKILRGLEHGLTRELLDDGLGEIVSDIYRPYREYEGETE
ncbi:MAG: hypothetical protein Q7J78_05530 [Clostridiales bacterium]|nr:hypothetical protein [Clostridiales bacterium]